LWGGCRTRWLLRGALRAVDVLHVLRFRRTLLGFRRTLLRFGPALLGLGDTGALLDRGGAGRSRVALLQLLAVLLLLLDGAWSFGDVCRARRNGDAAAAAVVADAVRGPGSVVGAVVNHVVVVDVGGETDVGDGAVIEEVVAVPIAAEVADADVAEAVVDATVEADVEAPVAVVKAVVAAVVAPVGGSPKRAVVGRRAPDSGDPVVAGVGVAPVAGGPDVVGIGSGGLVVVG